jgi:TfoX/Sxy family transcriptional regulator of competence genes
MKTGGTGSGIGGCGGLPGLIVWPGAIGKEQAMAWDGAAAAAIRADLDARLGGIAEKRMFGGLAFLSRGHMVAGLYRDRAFVRVGKAAEAAAQALPGFGPMAVGARSMPGMADGPAAAMLDADLRGQALSLAADFVAGLPDKVAKPGKTG